MLCICQSRPARHGVYNPYGTRTKHHQIVIQSQFSHNCLFSVCLFFPTSGVTEVWQYPALAAPRFTESKLTYRSCKAVECLRPKCDPHKRHFDEEVHSLDKCSKERQLKHLAASITVLRFCSRVLLLNCSQAVKKCFERGSLHTKHTGGGSNKFYYSYANFRQLFLLSERQDVLRLQQLV